MAKSRKYSKKGRKTMRKKNNRRRRVRRGGEYLNETMSKSYFSNVTSGDPYSN